MPRLVPRPDAVIFDVDGTLCDVRSVRHFVQQASGNKKTKPNFDGFHAASASCPPHREVQQLAKSIHSLGLAVIIVTGREAKWAELTERWLSTHKIPFDAIKTRNRSDYRPDHVIKAEIEAEVSKDFRVLLAVDDRLDIISVWRASGIPTAQVTADGRVLPVMTPSGASLDPRIAKLTSPPFTSSED